MKNNILYKVSTFLQSSRTLDTIPNGKNLTDFYVIAPDPETAIDLCRQTCEINGIPTQGDMDFFNVGTLASDLLNTSAKGVLIGSEVFRNNLFPVVLEKDMD